MEDLANKPRQRPTPVRDRVRELHAKGLTAREIATLLAISTQRVYQHLDAIRTEDGKGLK
jgi:hypothetical protein